MKKPLHTYMIIVPVVVGLTIKGGKDNTGFVLLVKWSFPQVLRYYDNLHDCVCGTGICGALCSLFPQ